MSYDVIVIGAGVNGLVAAHYLAKAGKNVVVVERQAGEVGEDEGWVPPEVVRDLDLARHGFRVTAADQWIAAPLPQGGRLELFHDVARSAESIRRLNERDARRWPEFCARMHALAGVLQALYAAPAPDIATSSVGELLRMAALGLKVKRLGRESMIDLLRIPPMSVAELLDEWFESDVLKGVVGASGVLHQRQGPRSGGTAFVMLHNHVGNAPGVFRRQRSNARAALLQRPGIEVRHGAAVRRIMVKGGAVTGVTLENGEEVVASCVVSGADPRNTLLNLLEPGWLEPELTQAVHNIKCRGVTAQVVFDAPPPDGFVPLTNATSLDRLEHAYDDVKYGAASGDPWLEARAEHGRIVVDVQYVPATAMGDAAAGVAEAAKRFLAGQGVTPANGAAISVIMPGAREQTLGLTGGQMDHGELTLDQILFMRPVPALRDYATPVRGLYLASAGTHPGGGILGGPGRLAAQRVLRERR